MQTVSCKQCQTEFTITPDDQSFYEKISVPPPTLCQHCRLRRRLLWRNERTFYRRQCDLCHKNMISVYDENMPAPVYCQKCWWGDGWDPLSYGREFDFTRSFAEQFQELLYTVPMLNIMNDDGIASVNSGYSYDFAFSKNCYMCVCGWHDENCMYSTFLNFNTDCVDCFYTFHSELCYECSACYTSHSSSFCRQIAKCTNCHFSFDLKGCSNCYLCVGLRNKEYCIRNQQYNRDDYYAELERMGADQASNQEQFQQELESLIRLYPRKYANFHNCVNCTGHNLFNCKNVQESFYGRDHEDSRYLFMVEVAKQSMDLNNAGKPELCYEGVTPDESYHCISTVYCWKCTNTHYSNNCHGCENTFGSSGVKKGSYVILNRRYSKEEYEDLYPRIIEHMRSTGEWGEFFPEWLSSFGYNETAAFDWFPLTEEQATEAGYQWKPEIERNYEPTISAADLPETIAEVSDDIADQIIGCPNAGQSNSKCTTAYKITAQELSLYRKMNQPLPRRCPNCRYYQRLQSVDPITLQHRRCNSGSPDCVYKNQSVHDHGANHCPNEFESVFGDDSPYVVYCESCYNEEIV